MIITLLFGLVKFPADEIAEYEKGAIFMKRIWSVLLMIAMCAALFGCKQGGEASGTADGFRVGYGKVEITPEQSVPLQGFGNVSQRMSTGFLDRLYTVCIAITDEQDNTVLLFGSDLTTTYEALASEIRVSISNATGVPVEHIILNASHSHSAPATDTPKIPSQFDYNNSLVQWMTDAAVMAMEDRRSAEMYVGAVEIEKQNFVRHYKLADGTSVGYDSMARGENPVAHEGVGDHTMQFVKFTRDGGKDVLLSNWQAHPTRTGGSSDYDASADIIGVLRDTLEQELDCCAVYFQGAAGNMNASSFVEGEEVAESYREQGRQIAQQVIDAGDTVFTKVETGSVQTMQVKFAAKIDHTQDHLLTYATKVQQVWTSTNNRTKADEAGAPYGIRSPYHANKIVNMAKRKEETVDLELNVIAIGDVAFATAPNELFAAMGIQIKESSPYKQTIVMGYSNAHYGYLPASEAFEYMAYEVDITWFERGTGELVAQKLSEMLNELKSGV